MIGGYRGWGSRLRGTEGRADLRFLPYSPFYGWNFPLPYALSLRPIPVSSPLSLTGRSLTISYCLKDGYGTRLIPSGTISSAHFVKVVSDKVSYVQITGNADVSPPPSNLLATADPQLTKIGLMANDDGGELDPHCELIYQLCPLRRQVLQTLPREVDEPSIYYASQYQPPPFMSRLPY